MEPISKEKAEALVDKLLDIAEKNPASWVILIVYSAALIVFGAWLS